MGRSSRRSLEAVMVCTAVLSLAGPALAQQGSMNVNLFHHLTLGDFRANAAMDCWGYVSESGREYALVGLSTGTAFVEITDPSNPVIVEQVSHPRGGKDIKVYRDYAYVTTDNGPLQVIDMSDIDNGNVTLVRTLNTVGHNLIVNEDSGYLYRCNSRGLAPLNLADPSNPIAEGSGWNGECHDAQVVTYTEGPYAGKEIAFVFAGWSNKIDIVDVTDKSNTRLLSRRGYAGSGYTHQGWLSADRQYLYVDDELDEINGDTDVTLTFVWGVADLSNPSLLDTFTTGLPATDHNLYVKDGFVVEANYKSGMHIFDVQADPVNPPRVGFYDTYPGGDENGYDGGAWTAYPYFPSGTIIVSDEDGGLFILDPREAMSRGCTRSPEWICDGDTDGDGQVNPVDSGLVQAAFGSTDDQDLCNYDLDCDGQINPVDSGIVQSLFGTCEAPRSVCP